MNELDENRDPGNNESSEAILKSDLAQALVLPVIHEEVSVEKRIVTTGKVRIHKVVHQTECLVDELVRTNQVEVERIAVNRIVEGPLPVRHEGETAVYSVVEEVVVVTKQFVLKEELRITSRIFESHHHQPVTLSAEELVVERETVVEPKNA